MLSASPAPSVYVEAEYGFLQSHDQSQWAGEWHGDLKYDLTEALCLSLGFNRSHEKEIEPGVRKIDTRPRLGLLYYLGSGDGIEFEFSQGFLEEQERSVEANYRETSLSASYSRSPIFTASIRAEHRSRKIDRLSPKTFWLFTEVTADLLPNLSLRVLVGSVMGGLVCSSGICRLEPDFEGAKALLSLMF
jgi:hypothetical protein